MRVRGTWERLLRSGWEKQIPLRGMTERKAMPKSEFFASRKAKAKADSSLPHPGLLRMTSLIGRTTSEI